MQSAAITHVSYGVPMFFQISHMHLEFVWASPKFWNFGTLVNLSVYAERQFRQVSAGSIPYVSLKKHQFSLSNLLRIPSRKWRPGPISGTKNGPKSGIKTGSPLGSPGARKSCGFKGFWSFLAYQRGPVLDSFWTLLRSIPGPLYFGTFQDVN